MTLLPESRGYGGSQGPSLLDAVRGGIDTTFSLLQGLASEANAAVDWACLRPDVDGDLALYAWKDDNSRGFGEGLIVRRGPALLVEPWAGVSPVLEPFPDNALQISYERQG